MKVKKALILSLGRTNSLPGYAKSIYTHLNPASFDVMLSRQSETLYDGPNAIKINTYTNGKQFLLRSLFYFPFVFIGLIPRLWKQYNVLYLPYMHFWDMPFIFFFKLTGKKVILTVHDGELHKGENGLLPRTQNYLEIKLADELIFLTRYVQNNVKEKFSIDKPSYIVPHGLIGEGYINQGKKVKKGRNLLFLGRISPYKGVEMLMEAVTEMNDIDKLIVAGKSIYKINYSVHPKIEVIDKYLSDNDIAKLLDWADVLVLPYLEASQSGVIALGITATIPMVCTNVGGFSEQLSTDEAVFVNPTKSALQQGILHLLNNEGLYNSMVAHLEVKRKILSWTNIAQQVEKIIR
jgi:glycosyltransferase involved in cell wall biosynthesis